MLKRIAEKIRQISRRKSAGTAVQQRHFTDAELRVEAKRFSEKYGELIKKLSHE